jgi:hypothetical protein
MDNEQLAQRYKDEAETLRQNTFDNLPLGPALQDSLSTRTRRACRNTEYADLGGYDVNPLGELLKEIDYAFSVLKKARKEAQFLKTHTHEWDNDEYCIFCGADGRA